MRIGPLKLNEEKLVIEPVEKPSKQEPCTKVISRKLTTLDFIGLALLSTSVPTLLVGTLTELGNRRDRKE